MGLEFIRDEYILTVRDFHSGYVWSYHQSGTDARNTALTLLVWAVAFEVSKQFMSNGPPHYKNETTQLLTNGLCNSNRFTIPYTPLSNGAVEGLSKGVLHVPEQFFLNSNKRPTFGRLLNCLYKVL